MFLSGFAALGYEMVWVRSLSAGLGHELLSVLAVMAAFFLGTALGAWLLDRPIRISRGPRFWYAGLESILALWAVILSFLISRMAPMGAGLMGVSPSPLLQWSVTFLLPFILLLPATMAMGATLPAMDAVMARLQQKTRVVGGLYGANTLGAVAGTLAATYWIVPALGFSNAQFLLASVSVICAVGIFTIRTSEDKRDKPPEKNRASVPDAGILLPVLFLTGLLGIGYEVLVIRILSQILENTVFSYAALLSVYLLGTAAGAAFYQRRLLEHAFTPTLAGLIIAQALACTAGMWTLNFSAGIYTSISQLGMRAAEAGMAAAAFLAPTFIMGALFSHLAQAVRQTRKGLGAALAVNTLGASLAPFLFGVLLLPAWGPAGSMVAVCTGYILILLGVRPTATLPAAGSIAAAALIFIVPGSFDFSRLAAGETVVVHRHGIMAGVTVIQDARKDLHLKVNNHYQMGGTASRYSDQRQTYIPLLLHPNPKSALFLGLGTGTTFAAAGWYDGLQVDGVELIPEVVPLMHYFNDPEMAPEKRRNLHVLTADARRFVLAQRKHYDVIIADLFHPSRDGAGFLYTREHFRAVRDRLTENGLFCQWLPLYQMDLDLLRLITRTFLAVFPEGTAFLAHHSLTQPIFGLIGGRHAPRVDMDTLNNIVMSHPDLAGNLQSVGLTNPYTLLGCYLSDARQLLDFAGPGPINTDDNPTVLFQAPDFVYTKASGSAGERMLSLTNAFSPKTDNILSASATDARKERLTAYWQARNAYLALGSRAAPSTNPEQMITQLAPPLLDILHTSPDFEAAYRPLLQMAGRLHGQNPKMADTLLSAIEGAAPLRPEARQLRFELFKQP